MSLLSERTYQPGEVVIRQGEIGDTFYVIADGRARVTRSDVYDKQAAAAASQADQDEEPQQPQKPDVNKRRASIWSILSLVSTLVN